jgi:hypothetical protein
MRQEPRQKRQKAKDKINEDRDKETSPCSTLNTQHSTLNA